MTDYAAAFLHLIDFYSGCDTSMRQTALPGAAVSGIKCALPAVGGLYYEV
jgi:hypothetical protein